MKKGVNLVIGILILLVLVVGGYVLFHKHTTPSSTNSTGSNNAVAAVNNAVLSTKTNASLGQYLTEPDGQALYTYGGDTAGVSNCTGSCLASWPAYQDKGSTTDLPAGVSTIKRTDNSQTQYTYNGMPLYTFVGDSNGQVTGNGVSNFTVAKPVTTASPSPTSTPYSTSSSNSSSW